MKILEYTTLIEQYELSEMEIKNQKTKNIWIELNVIEDEEIMVIDKMREERLKTRYKGFNWINIDQVYIRMEVNPTFTIERYQRVEKMLMLGLRGKCFLFLQMNEKIENGMIKLSFAFMYDKNRYKKDVEYKKINEIIEKRNDYLIMYRLFNDERYQHKANRLMKLLKGKINSKDYC